MCVSKTTLTVYFDPPFWVGLFQRVDETGRRVCKVTFGGEPRDQEVLDFLMRHWRDLRFSPPVAGEKEAARLPNPKRMRREARRAPQAVGAGTKAQQALQLQREQMKAERNTVSKARREDQRERKLTLRQEKRRQKHRGH